MLVLTRRPGEQIVIGNGIRVTVVSVGPGRVKLGIEAPADVRVDRQEVHAKIQHEQHEQATDVLAAVGRQADADDLCPTVVVSSDTSAHPRLEPQPAPAPKAAPVATETPMPVNRLANHRFHRKPR